MKQPNRISISEVKYLIHNQANIDGEWVTARPEEYYSIFNRFNLAWKVFTGKADALFWPKNQ